METLGMCVLKHKYGWKGKCDRYMGTKKLGYNSELNLNYCTNKTGSKELPP